MKNAILTLKVIHLVFLLLVLTAFAIIPFYYPMNISTAFVVIPLLFIFITSISVFIDHKLNFLLNQVSKAKPVKSKHHKHCPVFKGLCC